MQVGKWVSFVGSTVALAVMTVDLRRYWVCFQERSRCAEDKRACWQLPWRGLPCILWCQDAAGVPCSTPGVHFVRLLQVH